MMNRIELIRLREPHWFYEWLTERQERIAFLIDIMFTICQHYPDTELVFSLDVDDEDVIIVEPCGVEPYRFRLSEYRAIEDMLQPHLDSASYRDFIRSYRDWRNQFQAWWSSYSDHMARSERFVLKD